MATRQADALRADAQQNREHILEVAREAFASSGDASLNSIAKKAGVGPGTLYRHFPNREALVLAVYRYDVQLLAEAAPRLLADHPPLEAMRLWFDRLAHYGAIKHGLAEVLNAATSDGLVGDTYEPLIGAIALLLRACTGDGSIRAGHDPDDVLLVLGFLWRIDPGPDAEAKAARLLNLVTDGLRAGAPQQAAPREPTAAGSHWVRRGAATKHARRRSVLSLLRIRFASRSAASEGSVESLE
jgi:AcrR family transcriptional regulator